METDARREQEKEIEKQGSDEKLNDFLSGIEWYISE